jgi:hypothetical protein
MLTDKGLTRRPELTGSRIEPGVVATDLPRCVSWPNRKLDSKHLVRFLPAQFLFEVEPDAPIQ